MTVRIGFGGKTSAGIANQNSFVSFPSGFKSEIVINTAVRENYLRAEFVRLQVGATAGCKFLRVKVESTGERISGKAEEAATATAKSIRGFLTSPTR